MVVKKFSAVMRDPYLVLEVAQNATQQEIKRSYHALALKYHPDKAGPAGAEKFKEIQQAYDTLSDPEKRKRYDQYGDLGEAMPAASVTRSSVAVLAVVSIIVLSLILIFTCFLGTYVDGHLPKFNYVKVFSPLFVIDVFLAPLILFCFCAICIQPCIFFSFFAIFVCAVVQSILIPVAKDRNASRTDDFISWRVWLIPGYILSAFAFLTCICLSGGIQVKACGGYFSPLRLLLAVAFPLFTALVACRADEVITCSYFIAAGLPIYLIIGVIIIEMIYEMALLIGHVSLFVDRLQSAILKLIIWLCIAATTSLVCYRLDYQHKNGTTAGVYSLTKALIPWICALGILILNVIMKVILFFTLYDKIFSEEGNYGEGEDELGGEADHDVNNNNVRVSVPPREEAPATSTPASARREEGHASDID